MRCSVRAHVLALALALAYVAQLAACAGAPPPAPASRERATHAPPRASLDGAPLSADLWPARVLSRINEKRHAIELAPLTPHAALTEVATAAARECIGAERFDEQAVVAHAHAQLARQTLVYRRVSTAVMLAVDPVEAVQLEGALDPESDAVGIGVAAACERVAHAPRSAVVLIFGTLR